MSDYENPDKERHLYDTPSRLARLEEKVRQMERYMDSLAHRFVTKEAFAPVKVAVYSFIGIVLVTICGALIRGLLKT